MKIRASAALPPSITAATIPPDTPLPLIFSLFCFLNPPPLLTLISVLTSSALQRHWPLQQGSTWLWRALSRSSASHGRTASLPPTPFTISPISSFPQPCPRFNKQASLQMDIVSICPNMRIIRDRQEEDKSTLMALGYLIHTLNSLSRVRMYEYNFQTDKHDQSKYSSAGAEPLQILVRLK